MKKGISPLIGTVLLIGFTIGLAILIFSWGTKFTTNLTEKTGEKAEAQISCIQDVKVELSNGAYNSATKEVSFFIENKAVNNILSYTVGLVKSDGTNIVKTVAANIEGFGKKKETIGNITTSITKIELYQIQIAEGVCSDIKEEIPVVAS